MKEATAPTIAAPDLTADPGAIEPGTPLATPVALAYADVSQAGPAAAAGEARVVLAADLRRPPVRLSATLKDPLRFRESMAALHAVVGSDYRYVPKDRAAYAAFVRMRRQTAGLSAWQSQQAYFAFLLRNDPAAPLILDPVVTVHPDGVFLEVFSKDEGTYAKLSVDRSAYDLEPAADGAPVYGTTHVDFGQALVDGLQQMRGYRRTTLTIGPEVARPAAEVAAAEAAAAGVVKPAPAAGAAAAVALAVASPAQLDAKRLEKQLNVPDSWLRGFLQVQSAAALPSDAFAVAPVDLYNLLRQLRLRADVKGKRRGLRVELVPGEVPRLVLEPWETVLAATAEPYRGRAAKVVRLWGRRRLMLVRRLLPFVDRVEVHVLGSGLPSFWVLRAGDVTLTLGLTGFTAANWSQAVGFDLLLPRQTPAAQAQLARSLDAVVKHLRTVWFASANEIGAAVKLTGAALAETLRAGCQQGRLMFDLSAGVYRLRPLTDAPLDLGRLEYRNDRERVAHDLLVRRGAVRIVTENRIATVGLELTGKVTVDEDKREYRPQMVLGDEGQVGRAECTCGLFRTQGLKQGPCAHLLALRLAHAEQEAQRLNGAGGREAVQVETRTFSRRDAKGVEDVVQVLLERQRVKVRRGRAGEAMRPQTLRFNTPEAARAAYFAQVDALDAKGYLDATAGA
jgi:hypothetical protein